MTRKFLEEMGLDKNMIDRILDAHSTVIGRLKSELSEVLNHKKVLEEELSSFEMITADFKATVDENAELKIKLRELLDVRASLEQEIYGLKLENAVDRVLAAAGAKNLRAVKALLDLDVLSLGEDGGVEGLAEQIERLRTAGDSCFLFASKCDGRLRGVKPADKGEIKPDISCMTYSQYIAAGGQ